MWVVINMIYIYILYSAYIFIAKIGMYYINHILYYIIYYIILYAFLMYPVLLNCLRL
jgi:hypothetical protein